MIVSSGRPMTVLPLSLNSMGIIASCWVVTRSIVRGPLYPFIASLPFYLVREIPHHRQRGIRRRLPQATYGSVHHGLRKFLEQRLVPFALFHQRQRLGGAHPAGRALAARLVVEELHEVDRRLRRLVPVGKN